MTGVKIHIDRFGRVVIPKPFREACGLDEGTAIEIRQEGRELRLVPVERVPDRRVLSNGWIVFDTGAAHSTDLYAVIDEERERRLDSISG